MLGLFRKEISSMHAAAFLVGAAGLLSRLLGLFRDRLLAAEFGASRTLDIYYASFQLPDFIFALFLLGAATPAILPVFVEYWSESEEKAKDFIRGLVYFFSIFSVVAAMLAMLLAPYAVRFIAPGFDPEARALMVTLTRIMMLSPVFLGVSNILSSVVQAQRRFLIFSLTAIVYNLGIIVGILAFLPAFGPRGLAYGVILGAFSHMLIQLRGVKDLRMPVFGRIPPLRELARICALSLPRVLALSLNQLVIIFLVILGSFLSAGSIAIFQFSNNLRYLPVGIFGISYAVAAFPKLADAALKKSSGAFYEDLYAMIESILFWVVPIAFLVVVLRAHFVRLVLGAGVFGWVDTRLTAAALAVLSVALVCESVSPLFLRAFYAIGNTRLPLVITGLSAVVAATSAPLLVALFTSGRVSGRVVAELLKVGDISDVGVLGLCMALSLGSFVHVVGLWFTLVSDLKRYFGVAYQNGILAAVARIFIAAATAALLGYGVLFLLSFFISLETFRGVLLQALITFGISGLFYTSAMYAMGSEEMRSIIAAFRSRLWKRPPMVLPQDLDDPSKEPLK